MPLPSPLEFPRAFRSASQFAAVSTSSPFKKRALCSNHSVERQLLPTGYDSTTQEQAAEVFVGASCMVPFRGHFRLTFASSLEAPREMSERSCGEASIGTAEEAASVAGEGCCFGGGCVCGWGPAEPKLPRSLPSRYEICSSTQ